MNTSVIESGAPVVIIHMDIVGLTIARDLYGLGVKVYGLDYSRSVYSFSNCLDFWKIPNYIDEPERFLQSLHELGREIGGRAILYATSDSLLEFLVDNKPQLDKEFYIPYEKAVLENIIDKWNLYITAKQAGIPVPVTYLVEQESDLNNIRSSLRYPMVMKPTRSADWSYDMCNKTKVFKLAIVSSFNELYDIYNRVKVFNPRILLQEYINGDIECIKSYASIFDGECDLLSFVGHKKLQKPEGISVAVDITEDGSLRDYSNKLLKILNYCGLSEIEYKYDATSGEYKLIEINPRHWVWHQLGTVNGINITQAYYLYQTGKKINNLHKKSQKIRWIDDSKIIMLFFDIAMRRGNIRIKDIRSLYKVPAHNAVFDMHDPLPMLAFILDTMKDVILRQLQRIAHLKLQ